MLLKTYDPFREFSPASRGLDYDVTKGDDGVLLSIDLPGVDPDTVDLTVEGRSLHLSATRPSSIPEGTQVVARHRRTGDFSQTFQLGEKLDADRLTADYEFGVLTISIPVAESSKPRSVSINTNSERAEELDVAVN